MLESLIDAMALYAEEFLFIVAFAKNHFHLPLVLTPQTTTTFFNKKLMT
jgi:5-hydroxyisourate hydrolase-like protein (transthyretin family)